MRIPTDDEAAQLLEASQTVTGPQRTQVLGALAAYRDDKVAKGLQPFQPDPAERVNAQQAIEGMYEGLDKVDAKLPADKQTQLKGYLGLVADPAEAKAGMINRAYIAQAHPEIPQEAIDGSWPIIRAQYAKGMGLDKPDVTDTELYGLIGGRLKQQKSERLMVGELMNQVAESTLSGSANWLDTYQKFITAASTKEGYDSKNAELYRKAAESAYTGVKDEAATLAPVVKQVADYYAALKNDAGNQTQTAADQRDGVIQTLMTLDPQQREKAMQYAALRVGPQKPQDGSGRGGLTAIGRGIYKGEQGLSRFALTIAQDFSGGAPNKAAEDDVFTTGQKLDSTYFQAADPIKGHEWVGKKVEEGVYRAMEGAPQALTVAIPVIGIPINYMMNVGTRQQEYIEKGVDAEKAADMAMVAGAFDTGYNLITSKMLFGRVPGVGNVLNTPAKTFTGVIGKAASTFGVEAAGLSAITAAQQLTPVMVQKIGHLFDQAIPDASISEELVHMKKALPETALTLLPMAVFGTGVATFKDVATARSYMDNVTRMEAAGLTTEQANAIADLPTVPEKEAAFKDAWAKRETGTKTQEAAIESLNKEVFATKEGLAFKDAARVVANDDGSFSVFKPNGDLIDVANDADAATHLVNQYRDAQGADFAKTMDDAINYIRALQEPGGTVEHLNVSKTFQDRIDAGNVTKAEATDAINAAVQVGDLMEGVTPAEIKVRGESVKIYNAKQELVSTIDRIYNGADPSTIIHEHAESYLARRIADESIRWDDVQRWRDTVEGQGLPTSERILNEWFSQQAQAYLSGRIELGQVPEQARTFFQALKQYMGHVVQAAARLITLDREGKLPEDFRSHLERSVGLRNGDPVKPKESHAVQAPMDGQEGGMMSTFSLAQAETPEFKRWFGDSKVVDADGKPLVVYHGTSKDFTVFDEEKAGSSTRGVGTDRAWFFTTDAQLAEERANGGKVMPVYLKAEKIKEFIFDDADAYQAETMGEVLRDAQDDGYDAVWFKNAADSPSDPDVRSDVLALLFKDGETVSTQIKSAIGNSGTFDPANADITYSLSAKEQADNIREGSFTRRLSTGAHEGFQFSDDIKAAWKDHGYDVRTMGEVTSKAIEVIRTDGPAKAVERMNDPSLTADVRTAMGLALAEGYNRAGNYEAAFSMIESLDESGREAGRQVNAYKLLGRMLDTPEKVQLWAAREFSKAKAGIKDRLPVDQTKDAVKEVLAEEGDKPETPEDRVAKVIKKMKEKNLETPEKIRDALKTLFEKHGDKLDNAAIDRVFAEKLKFPTLTAEDAKTLSEFAKDIASAPKDSQFRTDQTIRLMDFVNARLQSVSVVDKGVMLWYASMLSGHGTHERNAIENLGSLISDTATMTASGNPLEWLARARVAFQGLTDSGIRIGGSEALNTIKRGGHSFLKSEGGKFAGTRGLELNPFGEGKVGTAYNSLKYVGRALAAEDFLFFGTAQEVRARILAYEQAKASGFEGKELETKINELLNLTDQQQADFAKRADAEWQALRPNAKEGYTQEQWTERRIKELTVKQRDGLLLERSTDWADRVVKNYQPEGIMGVAANTIADLYSQVNKLPTDTKGEAILKAALLVPRLTVLPFTRIAANAFNMGLDYSGLGLIRQMVSDKKITGSARRGIKLEPMTADQRAMAIKRGLVGLTAMTSVAVLARIPQMMLGEEPDDSKALFILHGAGAGSKAKNLALNGPQWQPYSIEIKAGDTSHFISFKYTPFGLGLALLGSLSDAARYKKFSKEELPERTVHSFTGLASVMMDQSYMQQASDVLKSISDSGTVGLDSTVKSLGRTLSTGIKATIPWSQTITSITQSFDPEKRDRTSIYASLMAGTPVAQFTNKPAMDVLGDPIDNVPFAWLHTSYDQGHPEAQIYKVWAEKAVSPSDIQSYKGDFDTVDQFYKFCQVRGQTLKRLMLDGGIDALNSTNDPDAAKHIMNRISEASIRAAKAETGWVPDRVRNRQKQQQPAK